MIMVNSSIYPLSLAKLLTILAVLTVLSSGSRPAIYVFFHGGTWKNCGLLTRWPIYAAVRRVLGRASGVYFLTGEQKMEFVSIFGGRQARLYGNYAGTDRVAPRGERAGGHLRLVFVGRVVRAKGIFEALEAVGRLREEGCEVRLTIVGDGEDMEAVRNSAAALPPRTVEVVGYLDGSDLEEIYQRSDVMLLPSYSEAYPYVVIEAMRAGLPVISTTVGRLRLLVREEITGLHVKTGDVGSVVNAVRRILKDRQLLFSMSRNCQDFFCRSLSKTSAEKYYRRLCEEKIEGHRETILSSYSKPDAA